MVIQCESCRTEFKLDESLLKKEGSKVRCSRCRHVFTAYPSPPVLPDETVESADVFEIVAPVASEQADEILPEAEKDSEIAEEKGAGAGLESDLDVIYQDVFSEAGRSAPDEETQRDDEIDDLSKEASWGEEKPADSPAPIFPAMDMREEHEAEASEEKEAEGEPESVSAPPKKSSKRSMAVLIPLLFVLMGVAAAYYAWEADLIPPSVLSLLNPSSETKGPADTGARLLTFGSVTGVFVNTEKSGPLFVIRGTVTNKYPQKRRYIMIKGSILDNKGVVVLSKTFYAGNTFSEEELKTLPLDEIIKAADNRDGMVKQNLDVTSGATIPFMVVFAELPDDLSEFTVEAVSSSPGS
ncbi:MAG: zinc-ribbon domain-containing protein [Deltaproteobacteria bacterium]|nr:zinc-ribbon domain-containing protein [Deltaproteobacteria bacterium]